MADDKRILKEIKRRVKAADEAALIPKFNLTEHLFTKQLDFVKDVSTRKTAVCSRRCLAEGTLVQTILGPKKIEEITSADTVYDENGLPVKVLRVFKNGPKKVVEVLHNTKIMVEATEEHNFLTKHIRSDKLVNRKLIDTYEGVKIVRNEIIRDQGIPVNYAYAIGALLGDGCSRKKHISYIEVSSEDAKIPSKIAELLKASRIRKNHPSNFTYSIYLDTVPEEYKLWCNGRYAHEKTCDIKRILSWDRNSRLAFLAGLIDTDGSVCNLPDGLQIDISMQAKTVVEAAQVLFLDLWNFAPNIRQDKRDKYKNGPVYVLRFKHNYFGKKILKDLDPYIQTDRKKWKPEYEQKIENNYNPKFVGVKLGNKSIKETYDLEVASKTNLYTLANGLVTSNSGKTESCAADLLFTCLNEAAVNCLYITLTRTSAKRIIWTTIRRLINEYKMPTTRINNTDLTVEFENGSVLYVSGAKDDSEIERFRGMSLRKVYIDECQSFRSYIKELINDIIDPATWDVDGTICLLGTPGPAPAGFFYDITHGEGWSNHKWTIFDNPFIKIKSKKEPKDILTQTLQQRGVPVSDPSIQREFFGAWTADTDAFVFKFNKDLNVIDKKDVPQKLTYIFGIDIGHDDADAIAVLGYNYKDSKVYLVEELITTKQGITPLIKQLEGLKKKYEPVKMVMDAGGLGKKIQAEMQPRFGNVLEAADKHRKFEYIELLNDDLRTGKFKAIPGTRFEEDCMLEQWDRSTPGKLAISDTYHSDINMAVLYGWRECKHYFPKDVAVKIDQNSDAFMEAQEAKEAEAMEEAKHGGDALEVDSDELDSIFDTGFDDYEDF